MKPSPAPMSSQRAVVLGASLAGLLAARVLSERFAEVLLLERDELPTGAAPRKGTPHAVQPHGLLARGRLVLEELFPGFTEALVAQGGLLGDLQAEAQFDVNRRPLAVGAAGVQALAVSRLAIEAEVRRRVLALPGVRAVTGVDVLAPRCEGGVVRGARWLSRADGGTEQQAEAALVVDCTGRGSRLPQWLRDWGLEAPTEERVQIGICYTSAYFQRVGRSAYGEGAVTKVAAFGAVTNEQPRPGVLIAQEPGPDGVPRWVAGVGGYAGDHAAATLEALRERARDIANPDLVKVVHEAEPIGEVQRYLFPHSQRRHYERLARFPEGLLAMGDALTSFNPIYGQGMTVAACEALALRQALAAGSPGLARRFFRAAARVIDIPWQLAVGGDLSIDTVPGPRPLPVRVVNAYIARLYRAGLHDAVVSQAFLRVVHMLDKPERLFAPRVLWRVLLKGGKGSAAAAGAQREALQRAPSAG